MGTFTLEIDLKEIILLYITIVGFISYVPQIIRLIKKQSSHEHSVVTWAFWFTNSGLYLLYLHLSGVTKWLIISQIIEVGLIGLTFLVILFFRFKHWFMSRTSKYETNS